MRCVNCGTELEENSKFCPTCGTKVEEAQNPKGFSVNEDNNSTYGDRSNFETGGGQNFTFHDDWRETNHKSNDGIVTVLKYYGLVVGIILAFLMFKSLFGIVGSVTKAVFSYYYYNPVYLLLSGVFLGLLKVVGYLAAAAGVFCTGFFYRRDRSGAAFTLAAGGLVLLIIRYVLSIFVDLLIFKRVYAKGGLSLFIVAIFVVILFALLYAADNAPYIGQGARSLQEELASVTWVVGDCFAELSATMKKKEAKKKMQQNWQPQNQSNGWQNNQSNEWQNQSNGWQAPPGQEYYQTGGAPYFEPLKTDRSLLMYFLLTLVTCGIYSWYFYYKIAADVNVACRGDGKVTPGLIQFVLLSLVTCGIYSWIWHYNLGNRLAENAPRYNMSFSENGTSVLMWMLFGSLLCGIGPFIGLNILIKNTNSICMAYNRMNGYY